MAQMSANGVTRSCWSGRGPSYVPMHVVASHVPPHPQCLAPRSQRQHQHQQRLPTCSAAAAGGAAASAAAAVATTSTATTATAAVVQPVNAATSSLAATSAVVLGYVCLIGSWFRSVPQIAKIVQANSAEGVSLLANVAELVCFTIMVVYHIKQGYDISTYAELWAGVLQDIILVGLILHHTRAPVGRSALGWLAFVAGTVFLFTVCPPELLALLQASTIFGIAIGSRMPQIMMNFRRGNSGLLSAFTCFLNVGGNVIRLFTTVVLTGDMIILAGNATALMLNGVLLYQSVRTAQMAGRADSGPGATASQPA